MVCLNFSKNKIITMNTKINKNQEKMELALVNQCILGLNPKYAINHLQRIQNIQENLYKNKIIYTDLWRKLSIMCVKEGFSYELETAYYYLSKPGSSYHWTTCGRNAMKKRTILYALHGFEKAGVTAWNLKYLVPKLESDILNNKINLDRYFDICKKLEITPNREILTKILPEIMSKKSTHYYFLCCEALDQKMDINFLELCYQHYLENFDIGPVEYAAKLLNKKISKKEYLKIGKQAIMAGKVNQGEEFFEKAYPKF